MDFLFGEPFDTFLKMQQMIKKLGYENIQEWLDEQASPKEYRARLSFYKARMARIEELTKVDI